MKPVSYLVYVYIYHTSSTPTHPKQAYSKPRCDKAAAPNRQLVMNGLTRKIDHYHYASVSLCVLL